MKASLLALAAATALLILLSAGPALAQEWSWPDEPENLQVLPEDFGGQRLRAVMTGFSRALGVRCSHCHVGEEGEPLSTYDFPSDENSRKEVARTMLRTLGVVNDSLDTVERSGPGEVNMWCHTCHRGRPRPMALDEELFEVYEVRGLDSLVAHYEWLRERFYGRGSYDFGERSLNSLGYQLLSNEETAAAISVFQLNTEQFPESANVWDSLAEGYLTDGQVVLAEEFYQKSLELDPENENATQKLREIESGG
jgi:tetratricopeptide (TPR) repeat protein